MAHPIALIMRRLQGVPVTLNCLCRATKSAAGMASSCCALRTPRKRMKSTVPDSRCVPDDTLPCSATKSTASRYSCDGGSPLASCVNAITCTASCY